MLTLTSDAVSQGLGSGKITISTTVKTTQRHREEEWFALIEQEISSLFL